MALFLSADIWQNFFSQSNTCRGRICTCFANLFQTVILYPIKKYPPWNHWRQNNWVTASRTVISLKLYWLQDRKKMMGVGVTALFLTPLSPLHPHPHLPRSTWPCRIPPARYSVLSLIWGSDQTGHSHLQLPSHLCKVLSEIARALHLERCLVAGLPNN